MRIRLPRLAAAAIGTVLALSTGFAAAAAPLPTASSTEQSTAQSAASGARYPVPYTFAAAIPAALNAYGNAPGSNDWSCKPSAAHPEPVVLTHGLLGNRNDNWQTFAPLLADEGYCVFALTYGTDPGVPFPVDQVGGLTPMEDSAAQLSTFVNQVLAATGATKVDILGHSEGTVVPEYYVKYLGGAPKVDKYVSIAPIWHGTSPAGLASLDRFASIFGFSPVVNGTLNPLCGSCQELLAGSSFMTKLRAGGVVVPGVAYTNIVTRYDELVVPYTSGIEAAPGVTNIVVQNQCGLDYSEHLAVVADPVAAADVLNALDPAHPRAVPCTFVAPFVG
ncbi:MAG TPA: alpha/beta fold hydrolase [Pseudonocardiaceae bacterium]|jgi:triacylglycerol esterase/lipase EstA (alpha/beta hydrolase family)|nr:alpha/beta fold hydrolase [Pseudonocardiaceae bacterium]